MRADVHYQVGAPCFDLLALLCMNHHHHHDRPPKEYSSMLVNQGRHHYLVEMCKG